MIDKKITGFDLPRMRLTEKWDFQLTQIVKDLANAQVYFSAFQDSKGELKVFHSGINEELYALLQTALHRNIETYDLFKLSLINAQKFRDGEMNYAFELMTRAIEYITIKNSKNLNL